LKSEWTCRDDGAIEARASPAAAALPAFTACVLAGFGGFSNIARSGKAAAWSTSATRPAESQAPRGRGVQKRPECHRRV